MHARLGRALRSRGLKFLMGTAVIATVLVAIITKEQRKPGVPARMVQMSNTTGVPGCVDCKGLYSHFNGDTVCRNATGTYTYGNDKPSLHNIVSDENVTR